MPEVIAVFLAGALTALATGLGAIPVFFLGERAGSLRPALWGFAAGVMGLASWVGLLDPALDEGSVGEVAGGAGAGIAFLVIARVAIHHRYPEHDFIRAGDRRRAVLIFLVLLVHSLPEGLAIGTAWASSVDGLALFVVIAIALHNVPEGTVTAIPLAATGTSRSRQFWAAVATSVPQPIGAVVAFLLVDQVTGLLPISFAFAGGAMLALTVSDLLPQAVGGDRRAAGAAGIAVGALLMLILAWTLGV